MRMKRPILWPWGRQLHRLSDRIRRARYARARRRAERGRPHVRRSLDWQELQADTGAWLRPARGMIGYAALLVVALLFTRLLRSRVSHLFFWFMLLMLPVLLLYTLISRGALKV